MSAGSTSKDDSRPWSVMDWKPLLRFRRHCVVRDNLLWPLNTLSPVQEIYDRKCIVQNKLEIHVCAKTRSVFVKGWKSFPMAIIPGQSLVKTIQARWNVHIHPTPWRVKGEAVAWDNIASQSHNRTPTHPKFFRKQLHGLGKNYVGWVSWKPAGPDKILKSDC